MQIKRKTNRKVKCTESLLTQEGNPLE